MSSILGALWQSDVNKVLTSREPPTVNVQAGRPTVNRPTACPDSCYAECHKRKGIPAELWDIGNQLQKNGLSRDEILEKLLEHPDMGGDLYE